MVPTIRKPVLAGAVLVLVLATVLTALVARARGADVSRCEQFTIASHARAAAVTGHGERVLVIGDSWSAGLGLARSSQSWPSRLDARTRVAGFSGSGFSEGASTCGHVSFADRAPRALRSLPDPDLVVVEGGLNDYDQSDRAVRLGFARLMRDLRGQRVVVVGPAAAPSRERAVPHVDALLRGLAEQYDVAYVSTRSLDLPYLDDDLHLTRAGHREFGDYVARQLTALHLTTG